MLVIALCRVELCSDVWDVCTYTYVWLDVQCFNGLRINCTLFWICLCLLFTVNSDLHFNIASDGLGGCGRSSGGFAYLWAGARATWGVKDGKWVDRCVAERD